MRLIGRECVIDDLHITRDAMGLIRVDAAHATSLLGLLITDDLGDELDDIDEVVGALAAIRAGTRDRYERIGNATRLVIEPSGARLTWAFTTRENTPVVVSLDSLSLSLEQLRSIAAAD